jgi:vitamin B12 transporter
MKKKFLLWAAIIMSSYAKSQVTDSIRKYDPVTVTATKTIRKQSETGKVTTVITKEILQNNLGKSLSDVLNQQAGVFIAGANNVTGSNQDVYVRGSGKVLFLLDGIPIYDPSTIGNNFDINSIALNSIEKIEILKGAHSTLYGSDAVAGVINIITNKITKKEVEGYIDVQGGTFNTFKQTFGLNGLTDGTTYNLNINHHTSDGFSAAYDSIGNKKYDADGFAQTSFNGSISGNIVKNLHVGVYTQLSNYKADVDGSAFVDYTIQNINFNGALKSNYKTNKGAIFYNFSLNTANRNFLNDSFDVSGFSAYSKENYSGKSIFTELFTNQKITNNIELLFGADYRKLSSDQDYFSISAYGPYATKIAKDSVQQNMKSVFASILIKNKSGFNIEIGGRFNKHSTYGSNTTFTLNPSYAINQQLKIFANVSSAFKAPSLYQLFGPGVANNKLEAEKSVTYEGGMQYASNKINTRIVYFNRNIKNGIDYNLNTFTYFNNNTQKDNGVEIELKMTLNKFTVNANYTYVTGGVNTKIFAFNNSTFEYDIKGDTLFNNLYRRPKHNINVNIQYQPTKEWSFATNIKSVGKRFEGQFLAAPIVLNNYYTIDCSVGYHYKKWGHIYIDYRNITNQKYFDVLGYKSKPNNFVAGVQIMF